jgi:hypothetical protein
VEIYAGQDIEARGWFQARKGELRATVHHPMAIRVLQASPDTALQDAPAEARDP